VQQLFATDSMPLSAHGDGWIYEHRTVLRGAGQPWQITWVCSAVQCSAVQLVLKDVEQALSGSAGWLSNRVSGRHPSRWWASKWPVQITDLYSMARFTATSSRSANRAHRCTLFARHTEPTEPTEPRRVGRREIGLLSTAPSQSLPVPQRIARRGSGQNGRRKQIQDPLLWQDFCSRFLNA
jgi:hypothetical protein